MQRLELFNPFNAPVYFEETLNSTMDVSRELAAAGEPSGTVIVANSQNAGRGRIRKRAWESEKNANLLFTILLRYPSIETIPVALTLRAGLAVVLAIEEFAPALCGRAKVKWPNDIMLGAKKAVGILAEADGGTVHLGIGINVAQKSFSEPLESKATSIALAAGMDIPADNRFTLLEQIICKLECGLANSVKAADWRSRLDLRLYKKGESVTFIEGGAESGNSHTGRLIGIGLGGELLIEENGEISSFITGELKAIYGEGGC